MRDRLVALVEQEKVERAVVVRGRSSLRREAVEDRREVDADVRIGAAVGLRRQGVEAIWEGRPEIRREEAVAGREGGCRLPEERQVRLVVVAERVDGVRAGGHAT